MLVAHRCDAVTITNLLCCCVFSLFLLFFFLASWCVCVVSQGYDSLRAARECSPGLGEAGAREVEVRPTAVAVMWRIDGVWPSLRTHSRRCCALTCVRACVHVHCGCVFVLIVVFVRRQRAENI